MLVQFQHRSARQGDSISEHVSKVLNIVDEGGLPYRITPMGTVVEGEWDEVMVLIRTFTRRPEGMPRLLTTITIDDRRANPIGSRKDPVG